MSVKIKNIEHLKSLCKEDTTDFFISLGFGRSSKDISYDKETSTFYVFNNIDDTEQTLTAAELYTKSNIGDAIDKGNFYKYS